MGWIYCPSLPCKYLFTYIFNYFNNNPILNMWNKCNRRWYWKFRINICELIPRLYERYCVPLIESILSPSTDIEIQIFKSFGTKLSAGAYSGGRHKQDLICPFNPAPLPPTKKSRIPGPTPSTGFLNIPLTRCRGEPQGPYFVYPPPLPPPYPHQKQYIDIDSDR